MPYPRPMAATTETATTREQPVTVRPPLSDSAGSDAEAPRPSITESVVTTVTGVTLGGAAVWFLAPICFVC